MSTTLKFYDKLLVLLDSAEGCLSRLYRCKSILSSLSRPAVLLDTSYGKLVRAVVQAFPDEPPEKEKIQGYDLLQQNAQSVCDSLAYFYDSFLQLLDFKEACSTLLEEAARCLVKLKLDENAELAVSFLDLLANYIQIQILFGNILERRQVVALYAMAYQTTHVSAEPTYTRLGAYITEFTTPIRRMQKDFEPAASFIANTLLALTTSYTRGFDYEQLRNVGTLSLTLSPEHMQFPAVDPLLMDLQYRERMYNWIIFGYLVVPTELYMPGALDLLRMAMSDGFIASVYRNEHLLVHVEYEQIFSYVKTQTFKLSAHKKMLAEMATAASASGALHKKRRTFIRREIINLIRLFTDSPGIIAPKVQVAISALALARDEVLWYFRHFNQPAPKKFRHEDYSDVTIVKLVAAMQELIYTIRVNTAVIQRYYVEYLTGPDSIRLKPLVGDALQRGGLDTTTQQLLGVLLAQVTQPTLESVAEEEVAGLEGVRLNWFRCLASFTSTSRTGVPALTSLAELIQKMNTTMSHSRFIDAQEELLEKFASLKWLYYYLPAVSQHFTSALASVDGCAGDALSYVRLLAEFSANAGRYVPMEREQIGGESQTRADAMLGEFCARICSLLETRPEPPERSRVTKRCLRELCNALERSHDLAVYRQLYVPKEYLHEALVIHSNKFVAAAAAPRGEDIPRPSEIKALISAYAKVLRCVEDGVNIDTTALLRQAVLAQSSETKTTQADPITVVLTRWFTSFVEKRCTTGLVALSSARHGFVNVKQTFRADDFRAEEFADFAELRSLCELVGLGGAKVLDQKLVQFVVQIAKQIKVILAMNSDALTKLSACFFDEAATTEQLKRLKDCDMILSLLSQAGSAIGLRDLLAEALSDASQTHTPQLFNIIALTAEQLPPIGAMTIFDDMEQLARDCGLSQSVTDQQLQRSLASLCTAADDARVWKLLPAMLAALSYNDVWRNTEYQASQEMFANNVHTIVQAFVALTVVTTRACTDEPSSDERLQAVAGYTKTLAEACRKRFLEYIAISSVLLMRLLKRGASKEGDALLILMNKLLESTTLLSATDLDAHVPYTLLRTTYMKLYNQQKPVVRARTARAADNVADGEL
eukprot:TRINITY_DN14453_c0_g1_i1.p1 TRINITY_DN14453_c0_g1~~TRINITY_DN14453_c0_g1_i1.p1  ORF type:complete len:1107 (-),score=271.51 TRINITY_DN14453_c0_g1_i1:31-3351(-)